VKRLPVLDVAVTVVLVVAAVVSDREHVPSAIAAAVMVSALAFRTTAPLTMTLVASAGFLAYGLVPDPQDNQPFLAALLIAFSVGSRLGGRRRWFGLVLMLACGYVTQVRSTDLDLANTLITPLVILGGPAFAGALLRRSRERCEELRRLGEELVSERAAHALAAAADERCRIARELHDLISHSVTVMVVQAGAAEQQLAPGSDPRAHVSAVRHAGKEALAELRRQLGVLREERADEDVTHPGAKGVTTA
jgi:signal transduction histidine kinase